MSGNAATGQAEDVAASRSGQSLGMKPTDIKNPDYFHKVVDCQWACPAHTPVPEYIRLIAAGRYSDAYMVNWHSNVFPGILGRTCDRPCEPACRRGRVEEAAKARVSWSTTSAVGETNKRFVATCAGPRRSDRGGHCATTKNFPSSCGPSRIEPAPV